MKISKFPQLPAELPRLFQQRIWLLRWLFVKDESVLGGAHQSQPDAGQPQSREMRLKALDSTPQEGKNLRFFSAFFLALRTR